MRRDAWLALAIVAGVLVAYTIATWRSFTSQVPGGNDLLANVAPWRGYFEEGINPYSLEAARNTQQLIYGRPALPTEDQNRLVYPFYSALVHAPLAVLDFALARAIFMTVLQVALVGGTLLTMAFLRWRPAMWLVGLMLLWSVVHYPHGRSVILGQFAPLGFLALAASLVLLSRQRDMAAGAALTLATVKPPLIFLAMPFMLVWTLSRRRWSFAAGLGLSLAAAALISLLVLPTWIGDWLERVFAYPSYTGGQSPVWLFTHFTIPALGDAGSWLISLGVLAAMGWSWWASLREPTAGPFLWALSLTLVVSNLVAPRSATTNYVMLMLPTLWVFAALERGRSWVPVVLIMAVALIGHWWLHFATVVGNQEQPILFAPVPLLVAAAIVLGRRPLLADAESAGIRV